jgi:hypothetical protein
LLSDLLDPLQYYWIIEQAEYATDVLFKDRAALQPLYSALLRHATLCLGAEDILTFLGRKLHPAFQGEVGNAYKNRWPGARVKHRMKENGIKMYDKHGVVLRIETVINRPYEFKVRRHGLRRGKPILGWFPMAKGVANLYRYAEVSLAANGRYLTALSTVEDPARAQEHLLGLGAALRRAGRSYRGFNPLSRLDLGLFSAVLRGEYTIMGFRNRDIRLQLYPKAQDPISIRKLASRISRLLKLLHVRALLAKIPRSRRWRLTKKGHAVLSAIITTHHDHYQQSLITQAG